MLLVSFLVSCTLGLNAGIPVAFLRSVVCFQRHGTVNRATPVPSRTAEILMVGELTHILLIVRMLLNSVLMTWVTI